MGCGETRYPPSDIHYSELGVLRCLSSCVTGQEFLQYYADQNVAKIDADPFFKALQSPRRLFNITSLNDLLARPMKQHISDPYVQCPELDCWEIYAVDGHYHKAACFDPKTLDSKDNLRAIATGLYQFSHHTSHSEDSAIHSVDSSPIISTSSLERGGAAPSVETLERLAYVLGVSPSEIFKRVEKKITKTPRFKKS